MVADRALDPAFEAWWAPSKSRSAGDRQRPHVRAEYGVPDTLFGLFPFLRKLFADGGYQGPKFQKVVKKALPGLAVEIVKRSDQARGFEVIPKRWVVERTFAWLNRCRRLAKDFENLVRNAMAFLRLASIRLMLRRLCNPS